MHVQILFFERQFGSVWMTAKNKKEDQETLILCGLAFSIFGNDRPFAAGD
jgi:hypothetical protein